MRVGETIGLIRAMPDIHSLGLASVASLLRDCGLRALIADGPVVEATGRLGTEEARDRLEQWILGSRLTALGVSYRLDPLDGVARLEVLLETLRKRKLLARSGGPLKELYFAGLPAACVEAQRRIPELTGTFSGGETPHETLAVFGLPPALLPPLLQQGTTYDAARWQFAQALVASEIHREFVPEDRSHSVAFGTVDERLEDRLNAMVIRGQLPLMRAHVGPWGSPRRHAVETFLDWARTLGREGFLDILSIGSSQLTQDAFFDGWEGRPNGGGVPLQGEKELAEVWKAARPLLVRTYAGTKDMERLVDVYERSIHAAWHTLSFWWFNRLDGRGPSALGPSLEEHFRTLKKIAQAGKPFEPNVPHHFAFRGSDDVSYVVSGYLAARAAHEAGIRTLVLQVMLNTPRATWGIQDLAKARALLTLVRVLEGPTFRVVLQPRAGLDYFSADPEKAKIQLVASTALMDDIEPLDATSPGIVHVVSYSEASAIADPSVIRESVQLTQTAFREYRRLRARGEVENLADHEETRRRTRALLDECRVLINAIEASIAEPYTAAGFLKIARAGFLPLPDLWEGRDELKSAVGWSTSLKAGSVVVVDSQGNRIDVAHRLPPILEALRGLEA